MTGPLTGFRVLDMSEVMQGPLAAQALGDYGAVVTKVERGTGDLMRSLDRDAVANGQMSSYFTAVNRNKRSIRIDLKAEAGMKILHELISQSDVLIHSYRPAGIARLGLSFQDIHAQYPSLVYASASGWGDAGPLADRAGQDLLAQSYSGLARAVGDAEDIYQLNPTPTVDFASGMTLAQGILAALLSRSRTGEGQHVSVNLLDTAIAQQLLESASLLMYDRELNWVTQWWNGVFTTSDGLVTVVGLFRENALRMACQALGSEDISERGEFATSELQAKNRQESMRILQPFVSSLSTAETIARFDAVDLLCSPLLTLQEALVQDQVALNKRIVQVDVPGQGTMPVFGHPLRMSTESERRVHSVPRAGEHTDEVLAELGHGRDEIKVLRTGGIVG